MRILLVADQITAAGGAETVVRSLIHGLDERGHDVCVIASKIDVGGLRLPARVSCHLIPSARDDEASPAGAAARAVAHAAEHFRPDVAHVHDVVDADVVDALQQRWPLVWQASDHSGHCPNGDRVYPRSRGLCRQPLGLACAYNSVAQGCVDGPGLETVRAIRRRRRLWRSLSRADVILASGAAVVELLVKNGALRRRIKDVPPFTAFADLPAPPPPARSPRVLFVGALVPRAGIEDVVRLAQAAKDRTWPARIGVAGEGPGLDALRRAAAQTGALDVLGRVDGDALSREYAAASAVIVPSRWAAPSSLTGIEAMAHARPVVAYDVGGVREWLRDGETGVAVKAWDAEAFVAAVERITSATTFAQELGAAGWRAARARFRPRQGLQAIDGAYRDALAARGTTPAGREVRTHAFRAIDDAAAWRDALGVRLAVFVREQDVPETEEMDGHDVEDATCVHVVARGAGGRAVGAGRLYARREEGEAQLGRMAVLPAYRGAGVGARIMAELLHIARERGYRQVVLEAQTHALPFYARWRFVPEGAEYVDCGIPHQRMRAPVE